MSGPRFSRDRVVGLSGHALDLLMPMHLWIDPDGTLTHAGPTLQKMAGATKLQGQRIFDVLQVRKPVSVVEMDDLVALSGRRIGLVLEAAPDLPLRAALTALPETGGLIMNVALGLSFVKAVARFNLTLNDFSPCDQTVELLYLHEANASTMKLSRRLSERLEAARAMAERQALTEPLTGLANRRAMDMALQDALDDHGQDFALLQIDLDLFKQVNDTHGHAAGDAVLERVGEILKNDLRHTDTPGRVGGDEFLVVVRDCTDHCELGAIAARLIRHIEEPMLVKGTQCRISASIGVTVSSDYTIRPSMDQMIADADVALYQAKRAGRGTHVMHGSVAPQITAGRRANDPAGRVSMADLGERPLS